MGNRRQWQTLTLMEENGERDAKERIAMLTKEERQIIASVATGLNYKQIADHLLIDETKIRECISAIFDKLKVSNYLELVIYAYYYDLATVPH